MQSFEMDGEIRTDLETLVAELQEREIKLWIDGERLRYIAPEGALTSSLRAQLKAYRAELITLLGKGQNVAPAARTHPASFVQRRFWALQRLNPGEAFYNVPFVFRLSGALDSEILRNSFNAVVGRHEVLRTTLQDLDGQLVQVVAPAAEVNLVIADLTGCACKEKATMIESRLQAEMQRPFDLARESGLRVFLLKEDDRENILLLCLHNTLYDQSSLMVLLDELSLQYAALASGVPTSLPPPAQYAEYAAWQNALPGSGMEERIDYWREWFKKGQPPEWVWTPSKPSPPIPGFHSHVPWLRCSPELTRQVKDLGQRNGLTPYTVLLTAYAIMVRRYTGCADLTVGTTYSNRQQSRFASLVGPTIDVPALRIVMNDNPALTSLFARVRNVVISALTYQDVPFEQVAPHLGFAETPRGPLFRVVFTYFPETPHGRLRLPEIQVTFLEDRINELSRPDLYLVFWENSTADGDALTGYWMHKQDTFSRETADRMSQEFELLLKTIVDHSTETVEAILNRSRKDCPGEAKHGNSGA